MGGRRGGARGGPAGATLLHVDRAGGHCAARRAREVPRASTPAWLRTGAGMTRVIIAILSAFAIVVPRARRADWIAQWRGELWHFDQWLTREGVSSAARAF